MEKYAPRDMDGKDLQVGDWVRVLLVPLSIKTMPPESKEAFSNAVGRSFQIEAFDEAGCIEVDLWPKVSMDTIWLEPFCVRRIRRYKRLSKAFKRKCKARSDALPPRYQIDFDIELKRGVDIEAFGQHLLSLGTSGGFASWPKDRRIKGSVCAEKSDPCAIQSLEAVRHTVAASNDIESSVIGEVIDAETP